MNRALVVYHSRSGHTRRVAQALARRLHADLAEIRIVQPMDGALGYAFCALESLLRLTPALRPTHRDPASYALVVVGTPVWFWNVSSPVRSWLALNPLRQGRFGFFCTMGGSGAQRAFASMRTLAGAAPLATLALTDGQIDSKIEGEIDGEGERRIDAFVHRLRTASAQSTAARSAHPPVRPRRGSHGRRTAEASARA